jgi:hypothetical protein
MVLAEALSGTLDLRVRWGVMKPQLFGWRSLVIFAEKGSWSSDFLGSVILFTVGMVYVLHGNLTDIILFIII